MNIHIYIYTYIYTYIWRVCMKAFYVPGKSLIFVTLISCACAPLSMCVCVCMCVCVHVCVCVCVCAEQYVCMYVYTYVCMHACMHVCMYAYVCITRMTLMLLPVVGDTCQPGQKLCDCRRGRLSAFKGYFGTRSVQYAHVSYHTALFDAMRPNVFTYPFQCPSCGARP